MNKIYLDEIKKVLKIEVDESLTQDHQTSKSLSLVKDGISVSLNEIACFAENNYGAFFNHKYFKKEIELRVAKKLVEITSNPEKLKEFLSS